MIYLDNSATTKVLDCALNAAVDAMTENFGNPAAVHSFGKKANDILENARKDIMAALNVKKGTLVFTSGGTESINWAISFAADKNKHKGKHIVSTKIEHAATLETLKALTMKGYEVTLVEPERDGSVSIDKIKSAIREDTILLSIMAVCNETGAVLPYLEAAKYMKQVNKDAFVHVDGVQGFMKIDMPLDNVDFLSISAHKIGGVKGIGALYIRDGVKITPMLHGGYQDMGLRSGTQAVPQMAAFGAAAKYHAEHFAEGTSHMDEVRRYCIERLSEIEGSTVAVSENQAPHVVNVGFKKGRSEVIIRVLSDKGIYVSGGSACAKGKKSHVLLAMNRDPKAIDSSLRISLSEENTKEEIDLFIDTLKMAMKMFR